MESKMRYMLLFVFIAILRFEDATGQLSLDPSDLLDVCIDSVNHKTKPGPEGDLYKQCSPWKNRSCCVHETTRNAHLTNLYGFEYDHCGAVKNMSKDCRRHFLQDLCFYECSPNIGPWVVKVSDMKIRKERYFQVPLCLSDCKAWFYACSGDYTCTDNWTRNFIWKDGQNTCPEGAKCRTFLEVFETAENFCRKVWDESWEPVPDEEPCMRLWFDGEKGNPNERVAQYHAYKIAAMGSGGDTIHPTISLLLLLTFLLTS
ncbi:hypothetical protein J437_LFUL012600 [Ladona fulva]|uniref:Folate receptor-like domain-containing protein n=1 Tax=Ladona fulva TaxID=123851 RepID=A0A8K0P1T6_LADFU|nr:hypothetical protein J437_LFUL012600 [Ladona fulva]